MYGIKTARDVLKDKQPCFEASVRNLSDDYAERLMSEPEPTTEPQSASESEAEAT